MVITDRLEDVKASLQELKQRRKFKKANEERREASELQSALARCNGKLKVCQNDFNGIIRKQTKSIKEGKTGGFNTTIQEQMLWDAAIGYMLVRDAMFALKSISSNDSISSAYEMLDAAVKQMGKKRDVMPKGFVRFGKGKSRDGYDFITSDEALREKEELLNSFFEKLKDSGDIEACLADARTPADTEAQRRGTYSKEAPPRSKSDELLARLGDTPIRDDTYELDEDALSGMMGIHPPKSNQ